jgi:hypothetical protein
MTAPSPRLVLPQAAIVTPTDQFTGSDNTFAYVCVVSSVGGTYNYAITGAPFLGSGNPGPNITNAAPALAPGACANVANDGAGAGFADPDNVTATQGIIPGTAQLDSVRIENARYSQQGGTATLQGVDTIPAGNPATGLIANERATRITFFYSEGQQGGGEGCTPGYWKQDQHFDSWVFYTPGQTLESVFNMPDALGMDNTTLLQALQGGGGKGVQGAAKILMRAATAALLNSQGVNFGQTSAQVIASVNAALASNDRPTMIALAADLDAQNNAGCPLN